MVHMLQRHVCVLTKVGVVWCVKLTVSSNANTTDQMDHDENPSIHS